MKVGDMVVCVRGHTDCLVAGRIFTILGIYRLKGIQYVEIDNSPHYTGWAIDRFALADAAGIAGRV